MKRKWILAGVLALGLPMGIGLAARSAASWRPQLVGEFITAEPLIDWSRDGSVMRVRVANSQERFQDFYFDALSKRELNPKSGRVEFLQDTPFELQTPWHNSRVSCVDGPASACSTVTNHCVKLQNILWAGVSDDMFSKPYRFSSDGQDLWLVANKQIFRWSSATGKLKPPLRFDISPKETVKFQAISPDFSRVVATLKRQRKTVVFDTQSGRRQMSLSQTVDTAEFSPQGHWIYGSDPDESGQRVFDAHTGRLLWKHPLTNEGFLFSPDDQLVAFDIPKGAELRYVRTGQLKRTIVGEEAIAPIAFSPDSSQLLTFWPGVSVSRSPINHHLYSWRLR